MISILTTIQNFILLGALLLFTVQCIIIQNALAVGETQEITMNAELTTLKLQVSCS